MRADPGPPELGSGIARVLRVGTLLAMAGIGVGYAAALFTGDDAPGPTPVIKLIGEWGADAVIGIGLLGLTLIPVAALIVAVPPLARAGERGRTLTAIAVLVLLAASLAVAAVIGAAS